MIASASLSLIMAYIWSEQEGMFKKLKKLMAWAKDQLAHFKFLFRKTDLDDPKVWMFSTHHLQNSLTSN